MICLPLPGIDVGEEGYLRVSHELLTSLSKTDVPLEKWAKDGAAKHAASKEQWRQAEEPRVYGEISKQLGQDASTSWSEPILALA